MKRLVLAVLATAGLFAVPVSAAPKGKPAGNVATVKLKITGMHCGGCAQGVTKKLKEVEGVQTATVDHAKSQGVVKYAAGKVKPEQLIAAVKSAGYAASVTK